MWCSRCAGIRQLACMAMKARTNSAVDISDAWRRAQFSATRYEA